MWLSGRIINLRTVKVVNMSQAKVDRYKKEKKNRAKEIKLNKLKKAFTVFIIALLLGAVIGIPLGKAIYRYEKKKAEEHATISSLHYGEWFDQYWVDNYSDFFVGNTYTSEEATEGDAVTEEDTAAEADSTADENADGAEAIEADPITDPSVE